MTFAEARIIGEIIQLRPGWQVASIQAQGPGWRYLVRACYGPGLSWITVAKYDVGQLARLLSKQEARAKVVLAIGAGRAEAWPRETAEGSEAE